MGSKQRGFTLTPKNRCDPRKQGGFTLVELLLYTAVLAIIGGLLTGVLITSIRTQKRDSSTNQVTQQLDFVLGTVQRLIRESSLVEAVYEGSLPEIACSQHCTLKLRMNDPAQDPTIIRSDINGVYLKAGASLEVPLTTDEIVVDSLGFTKFEVAGGHAAVQLDATFSASTTNPQLASTKSLQSAIARVSAATFDSDLIPNLDGSFDIGQSSPNVRWQDLFLSNNLTIGGTASVTGNGYFMGKLGVGTTDPDGFEVDASTTETTQSRDNVRIGVTSGTPRIIFEDNATTTQWEIDNSAGTLRFFQPGVVRMTLNSSTLVIGGGTGKLTVGTVDPVYEISGKKYATYLSGMIGQKEEITGIVELVEGKYVIDFRNEIEGSDLWIFSNIVNMEKNFDKVSVILTGAFDGNVWYEKDFDNLKLTIHGDKSGEVSYRMTAPRFDYMNWPSILDDDSIEGLFVR